MEFNCSKCSNKVTIDNKIISKKENPYCSILRVMLKFPQIASWEVNHA